MEPKKSFKADLERKKGMFFQIGMVIALGVILLAFEWKKKPAEDDDSLAVTSVAIEEEQMAVTRPPEVQAPPPPPKVSEVLTLVENEVELEEDIEIDMESNDNVAVSSIEFTESRSTEEVVEEETPFIMVEDMPTFMGGKPEDTFREWIGKNTKYPEIAQENGITGKVYVRFCVNKNGEIVDVVVLRSVDPALDKEAARVIANSPKWTPGKQRGKAVKVQYTFPVNFVLQ